MTESAALVWPGKFAPLGATFDGKGVNFALFAERASGVELCLFDPADPRRETARLTFSTKTRHVWHAYVPGLQPGTLYGYRVHGPFEPRRGLFFNPNKLLVDPYARGLFGKVDYSRPVFGHRQGASDEMSIDEQDDAQGKPRSIVISDQFDWGNDAKPQVPWNRTVVYELHVKGFTMRHPGVPPALRGTYAGLGTPAAIDHLKALGITAVELLPVHEKLDEGPLVGRGLVNYWGYSTLGFFAPEQTYSSRGGRGEQVADFKEMVKALHAAGIEVILDVVYNHTGEGNHLGPTVCYRGIANDSFYRLDSTDPGRYVDFTGTGNTLNTFLPQSLKLVTDSLRYWAEEMRVDGFRFDLATTLGREAQDFNPNAAFFQVVHQDPVLSRLKLIAEPWDVGPNGYQLANFPVLWSEWNGKYRDAVRRYWRGEEHSVAELGYRLTGSSDLYLLGGRKPSASINFVTVHDGFTLHDLVSHDEKHNEANGEENRDGTSENLSWNCGAEGETSDAKILALREQQKRNLLATLFLSQGIPMLCAGDEIGRTQRGNNNAYCQDNEISWLDWNLDPGRSALFDFTAKLIRLRSEQPVLQRRGFFQGAHIWDSAFKDLAWFRPDGAEMTQTDWENMSVRSLGFVLGGDAIPIADEQGNRVVGDTLLVLMNASPEPIPFTLPAPEWGMGWEIAIDTANAEPVRGQVPAGGRVDLGARALMVLRHPGRAQERLQR